jgi:thioredoxin reductase (NADPH)
MAKDDGKTGHEGIQAAEKMKHQLQETFDKMPHDIDLLLFTRKDRDDLFSQANRQIIRAFRQLSPRINFREFDQTHDMARRYAVDRTPTLLVAPERYRIRWLGARHDDLRRSDQSLLAKTIDLIPVRPERIGCRIVSK